MNVKEFFVKCFDYVKFHWKAFIIAFIAIVFVVACVSCQGLVNFNGSDGNNLLVDSNNTTGSVSVYGK